MDSYYLDFTESSKSGLPYLERRLTMGKAVMNNLDMSHVRKFRFVRHQAVMTPCGKGKIVQRIWGIDYQRYRVEFNSPDIHGFYDEIFYEDEIKEIRK